MSDRDTLRNLPSVEVLAARLEGVPHAVAVAAAREEIAEARERLAQAEARATELMSNAIAAGDVQAINYFVAEKYLRALGRLAAAPNQKVLILPMETSGVIGSLAGVAEIAREAFGPQAGDGARPRGRSGATGSKVGAGPAPGGNGPGGAD